MISNLAGCMAPVVCCCRSFLGMEPESDSPTFWKDSQRNDGLLQGVDLLLCLKDSTSAQAMSAFDIVHQQGVRLSVYARPDLLDIPCKSVYVMHTSNSKAFI